MGLLIKLQDGDTAFKSLKFGNDRPGGGDSGQPYIKTPIERINSPVNKDFLLRGGINTPLDAAEDVTRLTKYFFDFKNPSGLLFTAKQNLLSRTGTKTEASKGIGYAGGLINEGIYTPLSTISEAGVVAFGGHLNKQGLDPTGLISSLGIKKYQDIISNQSTENFKENNRLVKLANNIIENKSSGFNFIPGYFLNKGESLISYGGGAGSTLGIGTTNIRFSTDNTNTPIKTLTPKPKEYLVGKKEETIDRNKFISPIKASEAYLYLSPNGEKDFENLPNNLTIDGRNSYEYDFYPSVYLDNTTGSLTPKTDLKSYLTKSPRLPETNLFTLPINASSKYNELQTQISGSDKVQFKDLIQYDLTSDGKNSYQESHNNNVYQSGTLTPITDIGTYNTLTQNKINALSSTRGTPVYKTKTTDRRFENIELEQRVGVGSPGSVDGNISTPVDLINAKPIYNSSIGESGISANTPKEHSNDLVHFRIGIVNPQNPSTTTYMNFRSFIDNFSDSYTADWDAQKYMGRAESFYKYNGFGREISIGFTVAAQSQAEMNVIYSKLNYLASSLAPTYTSQGYMAGNLSKITLGDYIYEQYGVIKSLSYDIPEESPWEITIGKGSTIKDELPMIVSVKLSFTPIHDFRPEVGNQNRFITKDINFPK
jgi:hypothetical protein